MVMEQPFGCTITRVLSTHVYMKRTVTSGTAYMFPGRKEPTQEGKVQEKIEQLMRLM